MLKRLSFMILLVYCSLSHARPAAISKDVFVRVESGVLNGTLTVPQTRKAKWVVLIVPGSGPTDRDGNGPNLKTDGLRMLAEGLAEAGVASLRFDKRGVGQSLPAATNEHGLRIDHYASDVAKWIAFLRTRQEFAHIAVAGHSEGALVAMLGARVTKPDSIVLIAGAGNRSANILRAQFKPHLTAELQAEHDAILNTLESGKEVSDVSKVFATIYRPSVQPYLISWFKYDPVEVAKGLGLPMLIIHGGNDVQVSHEEFVKLTQAIPQAQKVLLPGMNHILKNVRGDLATQVPSYGDPTLPLAPELTENIVRFLDGVK